MIKLLILDDKESGIFISNLLKKYFVEISIISVEDSLAATIEVIKKNDPDILIFDNNLRGYESQYLLTILSNYNALLIIISGSSNGVLNGYQYSVIDYLLKPIDIGRFINAIQRSMKILFSNRDLILLKSWQMNFLPVPLNGHVEMLNLMDIIRFESKGHYTTIYSVKLDPIISSKNLKLYENKLPKDLFIRVHDSHIINVSFIHKYLRTKNGTLVLKDSSLIPISEMRKGVLTKLFIF